MSRGATNPISGDRWVTPTSEDLDCLHTRLCLGYYFDSINSAVDFLFSTTGRRVRYAELTAAIMADPRFWITNLIWTGEFLSRAILSQGRFATETDVASDIRSVWEPMGSSWERGALFDGPLAFLLKEGLAGLAEVDLVRYEDHDESSDILIEFPNGRKVNIECRNWLRGMAALEPRDITALLGNPEADSECWLVVSRPLPQSALDQMKALNPNSRVIVTNVYIVREAAIEGLRDSGFAYVRLATVKEEMAHIAEMVIRELLGFMPDVELPEVNESSQIESEAQSEKRPSNVVSVDHHRRVEVAYDWYFEDYTLKKTAETMGRSPRSIRDSFEIEGVDMPWKRGRPRKRFSTKKGGWSLGGLSL